MVGGVAIPLPYRGSLARSYAFPSSKRPLPNVGPERPKVTTFWCRVEPRMDHLFDPATVKARNSFNSIDMVPFLKNQRRHRRVLRYPKTTTMQNTLINKPRQVEAETGSILARKPEHHTRPMPVLESLEISAHHKGKHSLVTFSRLTRDPTIRPSGLFHSELYERVPKSRVIPIGSPESLPDNVSARKGTYPVVVNVF